MSHDIPILMYHHVCPEPAASRHSPYAVTPELFRRQMAALVRSGHETVHLATLLAEPEISLQKKVVITFDDGARNLLAYALPVLREYRLTATFFVPSRLLGTSNSWDDNEGYPGEDLMSAPEVASLYAEGFEIGSHGARHLNLSTVSPETALQEMRESKEDLEAILGAPVTVLAYPYGKYPPEYADLCRQAGYRGACAVASPAVQVLDDPFALRRILIFGKDEVWRFRMKLTALYLRRNSRRERSVLAKQPTDGSA